MRSALDNDMTNMLSAAWNCLDQFVFMVTILRVEPRLRALEAKCNININWRVLDFEKNCSIDLWSLKKETAICEFHNLSEHDIYNNYFIGIILWSFIINKFRTKFVKNGLKYLDRAKVFVLKANKTWSTEEDNFILKGILLRKMCYSFNHEKACQGWMLRKKKVSQIFFINTNQLLYYFSKQRLGFSSTR